MKYDRFEPDASLVPIMSREQLNRLPGRHPIAAEADHFMRCNHCGEYFDKRNLGDVLHHELTEHEPIVRAQ